MSNWILNYWVSGGSLQQSVCLTPKGCRPKTPSIFKDIIQIEVDPRPSHPIFDKFIFDKVLIMSTSLPPLEFLTKIMTVWALHLHSLLSLLLSEGQGSDRKKQSPLVGPD